MSSRILNDLRLNYKKWARLSLKIKCFLAILVFSQILVYELFFYPNIKKKTTQFSILCSAVDTQIPYNWWLCYVIWHMKGFQLPAFIASHFGKILPVLPVNLNMSFLWKKKKSSTVLHTVWLTAISSEQRIPISAALYHFQCSLLRNAIISHLKLFFTAQKTLCCIMHWASFFLFQSASAVGWCFYLRVGSLHLRAWSKQGSCCFLQANSVVLPVNNLRNGIFFLFYFYRAQNNLNSINHFCPYLNPSVCESVMCVKSLLSRSWATLPLALW